MDDQYEDDYRYSQEAQEAELMLHWKCDKCGYEYADYPGINEGGTCQCGGTFEASGESYNL